MADNQFITLLQEFPALTSPVPNNTPVKHTVVHHRSAGTCPAPSNPPECLRVTEEEFVHKMGPAPYPAPGLHPPTMGPGDWQPCEYWALNSFIIPDHYPISHLHDFSSNLHSCSIFSKIDLVQAYHQILAALEDIPLRPPLPHLMVFLISCRCHLAHTPKHFSTLLIKCAASHSASHT